MRKIAFLFSLVFIFMIPWEDVVDLPGLGTAAKLSGFVLAAFWIGAVVSSGRFRKPGFFHIMLTLFILWNAVSIYWSSDVFRTATILATWVQLLGFSYILWELYDTRAALSAGLQMYILGAYVVIGNTVYNYFAGITFYYQRFSATGTNPDDLGGILALGIPVACYLAVSESTNKMSFLFKFINYAYIPAAILGIVLSGTRTALIAVVPGMIFGLVALTRVRFSARIAIILLLISTFIILQPLLPQASLERLGTIGSEIAEGDLNQRIPIWRDGFESLSEHPLLGVGSYMYRSVNSLGKVAHNTFLSVMVEVGLIGFILFGIILTIAIVQALRQPKLNSYFWLSILATWAITAFALTWEYRKPTWLFLNLIIVSAALFSSRTDIVQNPQQKVVSSQIFTTSQRNKLRLEGIDKLDHV